MKRNKTLLLGALVCSLLVACTPTNKDPQNPDGGKKEVKKNNEPKPPPAPPSPANRVKIFEAVSASRSANGHGDEHLFDDDLGTSWITLVTGEAPAQLDLIFPSTNGGVCIKQIGVIGGVFGDSALAKQVSYPAEFKITYTVRSSKKSKKKSRGPSGVSTGPEEEFEATLAAPTAGSTDIQWLDVPETCAVIRVALKVESTSPADVANMSIAELYVLAE